MPGPSKMEGVLDFTAATVNKRGRTVAANAALAIGPNEGTIILLDSSDANVKTATLTAPAADADGGPAFDVVLKLRSSTGQYRIPCTNGVVVGHVVFDAAAEGARMQWINGVLHVVHLFAATHA
jgi:hypothetical protein